METEIRAKTVKRLYAALLERTPEDPLCVYDGGASILTNIRVEGETPSVLQAIIVERTGGSIELISHAAHTNYREHDYPPGEYMRTVMVIHRPLAAMRYRRLDYLLDDALRHPDATSVHWSLGVLPTHFFRRFVEYHLVRVIHERPLMPLTPSCVRWFAGQLLSNRHAEQVRRDGMDPRIAILVNLVEQEEMPSEKIRRRMLHRKEGELAGPLLRAMLRHFVEDDPSWIPGVAEIMERVFPACGPERRPYRQLARIQQTIAAYHPSAATL